MNEREARQKAYWLYSHGYIEYNRVDEVAKKLESQDSINKDKEVGRDVSPSTDTTKPD